MISPLSFSEMPAGRAIPRIENYQPIEAGVDVRQQIDDAVQVRKAAAERVNVQVVAVFGKANAHRVGDRGNSMRDRFAM